MATTTRGLHKPVRTDVVLGSSPGDDTDVGKLAQDVEDRMVSYVSSALASRGSAGTARRLHYSTDTGDWALDSGAAWLPICSAARATSATGTGVASGSAAPIGTLTQTVSGAFSVASSTRLVCTFAGTYRATFRLQTVNGLDTMSSAQINRNMVQLHGQAAGSLARRVSISVDVAMSAGDYLEAVGTTSSGNHQLEWALIERVGP